MTSAEETDKKNTVSVIVSFRNEEGVIDELIGRLRKAFDVAKCDYEFVFVNDASTDRSLEMLTGYAARDHRIKVVTLSRRFGVEPGVFAGMAHASGDAAITIDADLQDPPELIPELIAKWRDGADVVYTVRTERHGEPWLKMALTRLAYRIIDRLATVHIPINAGDFRLVSRRVVDILLTFDEPNTYLRGLVAWVGYRREPVYYVRDARAGGETHFNLFSTGPAAALFYGITGFSAIPVYAIVFLGMLTAALSLAALFGALLVDAVTRAVPAALYGVAFALLLWSGLMLAVGVVGMYVTRVFRTVLGRPRYLVESTINVAPKPFRSVGSSLRMDRPFG